VLWELGRDRGRAKDLLRAARADLTRANSRGLKELDGWLREHRVALD
jgi:hypothetical protein